MPPALDQVPGWSLTGNGCCSVVPVLCSDVFCSIFSPAEWEFTFNQLLYLELRTFQIKGSSQCQWLGFDGKFQKTLHNQRTRITHHSGSCWYISFPHCLCRAATQLALEQENKIHLKVSILIFATYNSMFSWFYLTWISLHFLYSLHQLVLLNIFHHIFCSW